MAADAGAEVNRRLEAEGYAGWTIESRAASTDCVTAGVIESTKTVVLLPVDGPEVTAAMHEVGAELMDRCLDEAEAKRFLSQILESGGVSTFEIRTDGPLAYPIGQEDVVMKHVDAGCFVHSGSGRTGDGTPVYYLNGNPGPWSRGSSAA